MKYKYLVAAALQEELHEFIEIAGGKRITSDAEDVTITIGDQVQRVAVFTADKMGMPYNSGALMDVYHKIKPQYILYIGTCAGLGDHELGTVMVPARAFSYESGKYSKGNFLSDYSSYEFGNQLLLRASDYARNVKAELPYKVVTNEDMCSGAAVVDDARRVEKIKDQGARKLRGLEMEAFAVACLNQMLLGKCEFLVIKAISDKAMNKQESEQNNGKETAKKNAADFTYRFLQYLLNTNKDSRSVSRMQPFIDNLYSFEKSLKQLEETKYIDVISRKRLVDIRKIESELTRRRFSSLTTPEMEHFTSQSIRKLFDREISERKYYTTHLINDDDKYLDTWQKDTPEQNDRDDFVRAQRELLNHGGEVVRIFIFHRPYFELWRKKCIKMLKTHNSYYSGTAIPVTTLVYLYNPMHKLEIINDFSIVGDEMVFEWNRVENEKIEYAHGECSLDERQVVNYLDLFNKYKTMSKPLREL